MASFNASIETPYKVDVNAIRWVESRSINVSMPDLRERCQSVPLSSISTSILEARRLFGGKEHRMGGGNTQFDGRPFLVDGGGAFTAVDDLSGGRADCVQILRASELASHNARLGRLVGRQMNVIRADHDDDGASLGTVQRIRELTQLSMHHALSNLSGDKVGLTHKIGHEPGGWKVINHFRGIHLLEHSLIQDGDTVCYGEGFVMIMGH